MDERYAISHDTVEAQPDPVHRGCPALNTLEWQNIKATPGGGRTLKEYQTGEKVASNGSQRKKLSLEIVGEMPLT